MYKSYVFAVCSLKIPVRIFHIYYKIYSMQFIQKNSKVTPILRKGKALGSTSRQILLNIWTFIRENNPTWIKKDICVLTVCMTGVSSATVARIRQEQRSSGKTNQKL